MSGMRIFMKIRIKSSKCSMPKIIQRWFSVDSTPTDINHVCRSELSTKFMSVFVMTTAQIISSRKRMYEPRVLELF